MTFERIYAKIFPLVFSRRTLTLVPDQTEYLASKEDIAVGYKTAPREYFQAVIEAAKKQGLDLLAWVTMNSSRYIYHVDCYRFVQESRMFFQVPGKAFIVMLNLHEQFGIREWTARSEHGEVWDEDYYKTYWSGFVTFGHDRAATFRDLWEKAYEADRWENSDSVEFTTDEFFQDLFRWGGGYRSYSDWTDKFEQVHNICSDWTELMGPEEVVRVPGKMFKRLEPFLFVRFRDLQVTDFAPHYTFPGHEADFWDKFPVGRLKKVAGRIWGSTFSRVPA